MSAKHYLSKCPNCDHHIGHSDKFCSACGQNLHAVKQPFAHFLEEFLESTLHFDGKVWLTFKRLFVNPGRVIREYNENKKARYVPPIRFYIFISFIYFLLISGGVERNISFAKTQIFDAYAKKDTSGRFVVNFITKTSMPFQIAKQIFLLPDINETKIDSVLRHHHIKTDVFNKKVLLRLAKIERGEISPKEVSHELLSATSKMIFVLMPVFALILMLVMGLRKVYYAEALVFAMYFHGFFLTLLILSWGAETITSLQLFKNLTLLASIVYLTISIKHVFELGWGKTVFKTLVLLIIYAVFFILFFMGATLYSFIL